MKKLGFIGGGNMAEALLRGLIAQRAFKKDDLIVSDVSPQRRRKLARSLGIETTTDNLHVIAQAPAVVLAVKPQIMDEVLGPLADGMKKPALAPKSRRTTGRGRPEAGRLFISIAAGIPISRLCAHLGARARVIRVMPNAPAMVGQGMAAVVRGGSATRADEAFALRIFRSVGDAVALADEGLLDAVTALSGSGPAYVYLFVQAMAQAAAVEGLPADLALRMTLKTVQGAEENMRRSKADPADLIKIVASPGGTTEAALRKFDQRRFSDIVAQAVRAATTRSRELSRG